MLPEFKAKLLEALKSGKYVKGNGALRNVGDCPGHCVLGVICDLLAPDGWREPNISYDSQFVMGNFKTYSVLPDNLRQEINMTEEEAERLMEVNDDSAPGDWAPILEALEAV